MTTAPALSSQSQGLHRQQFAIALVSMGSLLLELALTRLFSVVLFYHFAFMVISIALLGLGAGGVFAFFYKDWLQKFETRRLAGWLCATNAALILLVLEIDLHSRVALDLTWRLTAIYLISATPFFLVGMVFSIVLAREPERITYLYGADLIGGAFACIALVPLLNWIGGPNTILCAAVCMGAAAFLWAGKSRLGYSGVLAVGLLLVLVALNFDNRLIDIVYAKGVRRSETGVFWARWNAISRVEVNQEGSRRYIRIDSDARTAIMNVDPAKWDADQPTIPSQSGSPFNWKRDLMARPAALVNVLRPHGDYAIIGPGGGVDVLRAVANGANSVNAIEINPLIANTVMRGTHADYSYHLYERPDVHLHVADGRSWIRASKEKYDVIQMTLVDTWASTAAGAFALSENNLYTVEAFKEYFDHLKPDGIIAITRWEFQQPREALRVVSEELEAMKQLGIKDPYLGYLMPRFNFIVVSDGDLNADGRPVVVLVKKTRFTPEEELAVLKHVRENANLFPIWTPLVYSGSPNIPLADEYCEGDVVCSPEWESLLKSLETRRVAARSSNPFAAALWPAPIFPERTLANYPYDISPVSDDSPFFFFTIKGKDVVRNFLARTGHGMDWRNNLGVVTLGMVLLISLATVLTFLVLPLALRAESRNAASIPKLLYFVMVGLGFILVEISFIQRFVLFLGHPTYALTVVVFLLLLASGTGSLLSRRWMKGPSRLPWILVLIVLVLGLLSLVLPKLLVSQVGLPFPIKILISGALLIPAGLLMGIPFPIGLLRIAGRQTGIVEWAWAMNAGATVLGSVTAIVIAIHFGLTATLLCGAAAYIAALAFDSASHFSIGKSNT
jgi:hypothetical protein